MAPVREEMAHTYFPTIRSSPLSATAPSFTPQTFSYDFNPGKPTFSHDTYKMPHFESKPSPSPSPPPSPQPPLIENPIGDLKELCDFIRIPYEKRFEEEGHAHAKRYKCYLTFAGKQFESEWATNQKEAEKLAATRLLQMLPVRRIDDSQVLQRGSSHDLHFQGRIEVSDPKNNRTVAFESDWMKKKLEARRDVMLKIVKYYFADALPLKGKDKGGKGVNAAAEHYLYSQDDTMSKVKDYISRWQIKHLAHIKKILQLTELIDPNLDSLITVAFIHPSFTHSEELRESVKKYLGLQWSSYERLEFYGDAVLGFVASKILFEENLTDGPHELTIKRQKMVREDACCNCMKKLMLDKYVIHRDILQSPSAKVLCDVYEAIIGAIYYALNDDAYEYIARLVKLNRECQIS